MATTIIRDDALPADDPIVLRVEGLPIRFRTMKDGPEGRATQDVKPDPYLLSLGATLTEWNSPDDAAAYDGL